MTNNTSVTSFDHLATETILEIFEYLSSNDIIYGFFNLNQRFHSILFYHQEVFHTLKILRSNYYFWQDILPIIGSYVQHLFFNTNGFWFSIDLFPSLKFLTISSSVPINFDRIYLIIKSKQFKNIISFKIQTKLFDEINGNEKLRRILFENIFNNNNSLKLFEYLSEIPLYNLQNYDNFTMNINIQSLSLNLTNFVNIFPLLEYTPNLKSLNLLITSICETYLDRFDLPNTKLEKLSITFQLDKESDIIPSRYFSVLLKYIKQFSTSLTYLSMDLSRVYIIGTGDFIFDGISLQHELLESMIHVKIFHLYVKLSCLPSTYENFLSTFKNQFWLEHNWSIGTHSQYLYTLPFHFDKLNKFMTFDNIKTNNPMILHSLDLWYRVKSIELCQTYDWNLIKQLKIKMPKLTSITLAYSDHTILEFQKSLHENNDNIKLYSITTVYCEIKFIENVKQWLIYVLPNVKRLVLSYNPDPAEISCATKKYLEKLGRFPHDEQLMKCIHFSNIQDVELKIFLSVAHHLCKYVLHVIKEILEIFENFKSFICQFDREGCYSSVSVSNYVSKIIDQLNIDETLKNYQIDRISNCLRFTRKK